MTGSSRKCVFSSLFFSLWALVVTLRGGGGGVALMCSRRIFACVGPFKLSRNVHYAFKKEKEDAV